jgi:hypothetical protein
MRADAMHIPLRLDNTTIAVESFILILLSLTGNEIEFMFH